MKYLNPKTDLTFKHVFGEHPDLVMSLLNALLPLSPEQEITDIEYLLSEILPENPLRKNNVLNIRCKDRLEHVFIVEIQIIWSPELNHYLSFSGSKFCISQLDSGEEYELLQPVYSLNLVNEIFEPELEGYYHHYKMVHVENSQKVIDGLQLIFVELPKFTPHSYSEKKMQVLWLRYLTEIDDKTVEVSQELLANSEVGKAVKALEQSAFTPAQLLGYEKFWDIISVEKTLYNSAERRGKAKGLAEGLAKGLAEGLAEGEKKKQQDIARTMKKDGLPIDIIIKYTGLTASEISCL